MPDVVLSKLAQWGLDLASLTTLSILTVALVELVKKHVGIKGPALLIVSLGAAAVWSLVFFAPAWTTVLIATLLTAMTASGAWQGAKTLVGKVGEDIKPMGEIDRGPSK